MCKWSSCVCMKDGACLASSLSWTSLARIQNTRFICMCICVCIYRIGIYLCVYACGLRVYAWKLAHAGHPHFLGPPSRPDTKHTVFVCVCMCVCVCVCVCIYIYIYIYIYTCACVCSHTFHTHAYIQAYRQTDRQTDRQKSVASTVWQSR